MISCAVTLQNTGSVICSLYIFAADFTAQPGGLQKDENISPVRPNPIYYIREYENISPARPNSPGGLFRPSICWALVSQFCSRVGCTAIMLITFQVSWTHLNLSRTPRNCATFHHIETNCIAGFLHHPVFTSNFDCFVIFVRKRLHWWIWCSQPTESERPAPRRKPGFTVSLEAEEDWWWGSEMRVSNSEKSKVSNFCHLTWYIGRVLVLWWWW